MSTLLPIWRSLLALAWPIMLSRIGILVLMLVDIRMIGTLGATPLAAFALANSVFLPVMVTGIGCMTGVIAVTAQRSGTNDAPGMAAAFRAGLIWASIVGLVAVALTWNTHHILRLVGQEEDLIAQARPILHMLVPGALFQVLFVTCAFWLEGTRRSAPALIAMIAANLVNIAGNSLLIPTMGAEGGALATTIARGVALAIMLGTVLTRPEMRARRDGPPAPLPLRPVIAIGAAGGVAYLFETGAFAALNQMAGLIGERALAAYSIAHSLEALIFMTALGLSVAAAVRTGEAFGRGDLKATRTEIVAATSLTCLTIGLASLTLVLLSGPVSAFFAPDTSLAARLVPLFVVLGISLIFDAAQAVLGQCSRAMGESWQTTLRYFLGFWCVMIPMGYILGMRTDLDEMGLFVATALGCITTAGLLALRLRHLTRGAA
ncbi:MATE family efflux transporter [Roseobacter sp. HKCCA0434]|uniref:MATE family efflux transporter n=1 Tax=Roseobacter sp. HKCCA0434 TaxID=3079297 RepID=UPI002905E721|nr:MATE family efflux transporter [Roseobacter sp. HKCCA0434]